MILRLLFILICFLAVRDFSLAARAVEKQKITVSGLSSGAFHAVQLQIARSDLFQGVAAVAGGIYGCAGGNAWRAINVCMHSPEQLQVEEFWQKAVWLSERARIADLKNLAGKPAYIFAGTKDSVVKPVSSERLAMFFNLASMRTVSEFGFPAGHGFPTMHTNQDCSEEKSPWLVNCGINLAQDILINLHRTKYNPKKYRENNLISLNQELLGAAKNAGFAENAYLYRPKFCRTHSCDLHIALHGCKQGEEFVGKEFILKSGFLEMAEANDLMVLFPQIQSSYLNPNGCWDWYGYTGADYLESSGKQIKGIVNLVEGILNEE